MNRQTVGVLILVLGLIPACDYDRFYSVYDDLEHASEAGELSKGWLPAWIPPDAKNIHEVHDLDTNDQAISFELDNTNEGFQWPAVCRPVAVAKPPLLKTRIFPDSIHTLSDARDCDGIFTVVDNNGVVHAWGKQSRTR
ncbi:MAG: hypothetical protein AAF668_04425 [Pseudomonadota bacterium]